MAYKIIRLYFKKGSRVISTGLTLEEAQAHCANLNASSQTCTDAKGTARTRKHGPWFDGYEKE
jgi:hypothetical protein